MTTVELVYLLAFALFLLGARARQNALRLHDQVQEVNRLARTALLLVQLRSLPADGPEPVES